MTIIRKLTLLDILKLQKMVDYVELAQSAEVFAEKNFTPFPFDVFHELLPINFKFLQDSYVATEKFRFLNAKILGLVSLLPDRGDKSRWKINRLVLDPNSYDTGKQLIDYVVNKYGGAGVNSFITYIDSDDKETLALFQEACLFRKVSQIEIWELDDLNINIENSDFQYFREVKSFDALDLYEFYQQSLPSYLRQSLAKDKKDFKTNIFTRAKLALNGIEIKKFVLEDGARGKIEGYFNLSTADKKVYWLESNLTSAYSEYLKDIINYSVSYIKKFNPNAILKIYDRKYFQGNVKNGDIFEQLGFKCTSVNEVLIKDYWKPVKAIPEKVKRPIMIFPDRTSPASFSENEY